MKSLHPDDFFAELTQKARKTRSPESVTVELTYGCNLRCVHCYNPTHQVLPRELTTEEVFRILEQVADIGVLDVTFTGGELLVRPDVFDIFRHAKQLGLILHLISNATRITPAVADALEELEFRSLKISLYGATKATYERVTRIPGSYEPFIRGLECLASRRLPIDICMVVMTDNAGEIHEAQSLVEKYGFKFTYCFDIMPKTNGDLSPLQHRLSPTDKARIDQDILGGHEPLQTDPCAVDGEFIACACGRNRFAITPYGEMNLCVAFPIPKYDLRTGTVKEGWEVLKRTVDQAGPNEHDECPTCDVRSRCRQGRSDAWIETGDMSRCLPHFKEFATLEKSLYERLHARRAG